MTQAGTKHRHAQLLVASLVWFVSLVAGFWALGAYSNKSGVLNAAPTRWPEQTRLQRSLDTPTLLVFAHPECPCTEATIEELNRIMARTNCQLKAIVLFVRPTEMVGKCEKGKLRQMVDRIPQVLAWRDVRGAEAQRFGAATSGCTVLYDASGNLLFNGGITTSRGHHGDNPGSSAIIALVTRGEGGLASTPVFGCPLLESTGAFAKENP